MKYFICFDKYGSLDTFKARLKTELVKDGIDVKIIKEKVIKPDDGYSEPRVTILFEGKPLELLKLVAKAAGYGSKIESINSFTLDDFKEFSATITN